VRTPSLWALLTALGATVLLVSPLASGAGPSADELRRKEADLAQRSRSAVLDLYSLNSRLDGARAQLQALQTRSAELQRERAANRMQLAIAERAFRISQRQLEQRLRALYEQDEIDPLAVVLGSASLDEAMNGIDGLNHLASQNESVIEQTRGARRQLSALSRSLAARQAELLRLQASAASAASALEQARSERVAYIGRLANERRLTAVQITGIEAQARAAQATAATVAIQASSPPTVPPPETGPGAAMVDAPTAASRTLIVSATGYALLGHTSTGLPTGWGVVAVDPGLIPLGTKLNIPGYGEGVAADTGGAVRGPTIDLWFPTLSQALAWGRRTVTVTLH
jgi:cystine transport system substrate-binding protein